MREQTDSILGSCYVRQSAISCWEISLTSGNPKSQWAREQEASQQRRCFNPKQILCGSAEIVSGFKPWFSQWHCSLKKSTSGSVISFLRLAQMKYQFFSDGSRIWLCERTAGDWWVDSISASLFVLNWLSWQIVSIRWQDPNNNTDTETKCLV